MTVIFRMFAQVCLIKKLSKCIITVVHMTSHGLRYSKQIIVICMCASIVIVCVASPHSFYPSAVESNSPFA